MQKEIDLLSFLSRVTEKNTKHYVNQIAYWANAQQSASEADIQEAAALVRRAWRLVKETL